MLSSDNGPVRRYLDSAKERLSLGDTIHGARMARSALLHPVCARDTHVRATALLILSQACILESQFRFAHTLSTHARRLFANQGDPGGQAEASALRSYSASALGRNEAAIDAAWECIALRAHVKDPVVQAFGLNYSGVASFWARDFATSRGVLEGSDWLLTRPSRKDAASFQPLVNLAFCEVLRVLEPERRGWKSHDYSALVTVVSQLAELQGEGSAGFLSKPTAKLGFLLADFSKCILASRLGAHEDADAHYLSCLSRLSQFQRAGWLHAVVLWARLERARARGKVSRALASASAMRDAAVAGEHMQLVSIADALEQHLLCS